MLGWGHSDLQNNDQEEALDDLNCIEVRDDVARKLSATAPVVTQTLQQAKRRRSLTLQERRLLIKQAK